MRGRGSVGVACAVPALLTAVLTARRPPSGGAARDGRSGAGTPVPAVRPSGYGAVFLDVGECGSLGTTGFTEVPCAGERAAARVVARHDGRADDGPPCPGTTDFVLHISERRPSLDEDGDGVVPRGYACMRDLRPPHPGDPGGGGGPRTVVGDCVRALGDGRVRETACDGTGPRKPQYKVVRAVDARARCPASTALYVRLDGPSPVGCARPV
ncbi:hypothetical protein ACIBAI_02160 [Streptomyces sp. NPDC051041]|uniref:hypothetical protein n=1 Tax=Streptomyces sp. NPDC051041 TaxID=3365640 RepID=UPI003791DBA3